MATLLLNGHLLQPIEVTRGVKQGGPLSSLLFLLSLEPLGDLIPRRRELGVPINDFITITGLYFADDSTLISKDKKSIQQQLQLVKIYCQGSGARLNLKKSTLMALNRHNMTPTVGGVRRMESHEIVKYLGIPFGHQVTNEQMLATLTTRFYRGFVVWGRRARTVQGRLLIVRSVIFSTIWHFTPHVTIPTSVINQ
ncbi:Pol Polyprotein [Phytophthora megakarya]|uniref:Pol Polyprotein n=1 Tax=Phytophthora megakarya TaxID=4795 RepID=A0A225UUP2_9STRA|nr:Pol Polyprotein [Phytophthora megakarya]